jgi:spore maturation protein A
MLCGGIVFGILNGRAEEVTREIVGAAGSAVQLGIGLLGVMCLWSGIMELVKRGGLLKGFSKLVSPVLRRLFPGVPKGHAAIGEIMMNFAANFLGLGNAATPLGIKAMEQLQTLNNSTDKDAALDTTKDAALDTTKDSAKDTAKYTTQDTAKNTSKETAQDTASDDMCMLLILNTSSVQLIPTTIIALRASAGSQNPAKIISAVWFSSIAAASVGIIAVKILSKCRRRRYLSGDNRNNDSRYTKSRTMRNRSTISHSGRGIC